MYKYQTKPPVGKSQTNAPPQAQALTGRPFAAVAQAKIADEQGKCSGECSSPRSVMTAMISSQELAPLAPIQAIGHGNAKFDKKKKSTAQAPTQAVEGVAAPAQLKAESETAEGGLPMNLKTGVEALSGQSMDDVNVHYNSPKPAQFQALAYAQGSDIYMGPGQEQHLPHEAWHVAQQKQGRVQPTATIQGKATTNLNDDPALEQEADVMGAKAAKMGVAQTKSKLKSTAQAKAKGSIQRTDDKDDDDNG